LKLLGIQVANTLKWNLNIVASKDSPIKSLHNRLAMLRLLARSAPHNTLKNIANGIIMSKILYGIETWG
jgi:hypothetical protein